MKSRRPVDAAVDALTGAARAGSGGALVIEGVAGVGKTTLLDRIASGWQPGRVIRVTGSEFERTMPLAGVTLLCAPLVGHLDGLAPHQSGLIRRVLGQGPSTSDATGSVDPLASSGAEDSIDVMALGLALLALLAEAARPDGLLVVVDDSQWLDPTTVQVVEFVARRLGGTCVAVVAAQRPTDHGLRFGGAIELDLLGFDESVDLLVGLGADAIVARNIASTVDGLPLLLCRIVDELTPRQKAGLAALPEPLQVGAGLEADYADLVRRLDTDERGALLLLAALGERRPLGDVDADAPVRLGRAAQLGLVAVGDADVRFSHPIVRAAVYWSASPQERRSAHSAIADALAPSDEAEVWHRAAAVIDRDDVLAGRLVESGEEATRRGAHASAVTTFQRAAEIARTDATRCRALVAGARSALDSGSATVATAFLDEADGLGIAAASTDELRARIAFASGAPVDAQRRYADVADRWHEADPERSASARIEHITLSLKLHDVSAAASSLASMPTCSQRLEQRARILDAVLRCRTGTPSELGAARNELIELRRSSVDADDLRFIVEAVTLAIAGAGDDPILRDLADDLHRTAGDVVPSLVPSLLLARAAYCSRFDLTGTATAARQAIDLGTEAGQSGLVALALPWLANAQAGLGDPQCLETCAEVEALGGEPAWISARSALGFHALTVGRPSEAFEVLDELHRWSGGELRSLILWHADLAEAALAVGRRDRAEQQLSILEPLAAGRDRPWVSGVAHRVRGQLSGDVDDAIAELTLASDILTVGGYMVAAARTDLMLGERLRRARRRAQSRDRVMRAREVFERAGMTVWIDRCDVDLHAVGAAPPATDGVEAHAALTAHELQIARWVTAGETNRDVARRLILSPRTVESHLSGIYRKLGVSGRSQLIARSQSDSSLIA
ncbi:MAG: LuxR C-terminal-related transcriptional regulator [Ilumatobacter sp.]|uniref:helix-turn-helix transcriptional regulator n=2 Tax=Ilumatobacter sp. TaxID=1967498 RepID=UPI0032983325